MANIKDTSICKLNVYRGNQCAWASKVDSGLTMDLYGKTVRCGHLFRNGTGATLYRDCTVVTPYGYLRKFVRNFGLRGDEFKEVLLKSKIQQAMDNLKQQQIKLQIQEKNGQNNQCTNIFLP
jgi:hypothetical protein